MLHTFFRVSCFFAQSARRVLTSLWRRRVQALRYMVYGKGKVFDVVRPYPPTWTSLMHKKV